MKKRFWTMAAFGLCIALCLTACSGSAPAVASSTAPASTASSESSAAALASSAPAVDYNSATYVTFTSGGVGGSWYILDAALNDLWEQKIPGIYMSLIPGGGSSNPTVVNKGSAMLGMTYAGNAKAAYEGGSAEFAEAHTNMLAFASLNVRQYLTILVTKESGITSFQDILDKKPALNCSIGPRGSGSAQMFERAFAAYGISMEDIASWGGRVEYTSPQDGGNGIRDGQLNVLSGSSPLNNPYMVEAATARELVLLPLDPDKIEELTAAYGYTAASIPKGTYNVPNEDVASIADVTMIVMNSSFDENTAYQMAKVLCENCDYLAGTHSMWKEFTPEKASNVPIPIHPGAKKYYDEMGY